MLPAKLKNIKKERQLAHLIWIPWPRNWSRRVPHPLRYRACVSKHVKPEGERKARERGREGERERENKRERESS